VILEDKIKSRGEKPAELKAQCLISGVLISIHSQNAHHALQHPTVFQLVISGVGRNEIWSLNILIIEIYKTSSDFIPWFSW
jgi:hypothetical protein